MKEVASPEEIRAEEITLKKFGLVPPDFDLAKNTVDLLTEQAAAFYDFHKKKLFISDWTATASREAALVHELAHALADQNFNLDRYIKQGRKSDDGATARLAVMEGQATWLMSEYLARRMGQSLKNSPGLVELMSRASDGGGGQFPVFEGAPLYLRRTLIFPYTRGMLFQHAVFEKDGQAAFSEVFRAPPVSTQQILEPPKYFDHVMPSKPELPAIKLPRGYKQLVDGSVGELDHAILIEQYAGKPESEELAPHWKGGRYEIHEDRSKRRTVLLYASEWDTGDAARRYFDLYRALLGKKWRKMTVASEGEGFFTGEGDDGWFEVRHAGAVVTSVEGLESPLERLR